MSKIIPYVKMGEEYTLIDAVMGNLFDVMKELGLADIVFANGTIQTSLEWLQFIKHKSNVVHVVGNEKEIELVAWLNSIRHNYAFAHFCCLPSTWGKNSVEIGKMSLQYWFEDLKQDDWQLDVVLGQIPAWNIKAIEYTKKVGMVGLGIVPDIKYKRNDKATGAYFCYITREGFNNG